MSISHLFDLIFTIGKAGYWGITCVIVLYTLIVSMQYESSFPVKYLIFFLLQGLSMCIFFEKEYSFLPNSVPCFCSSILVPFRVNTSNYKMGTMTKLKALRCEVGLCQACINLHDSGRSKISLFALFMASFLTNSFKG